LCGSRGQFYAQARDIEYFTSDATFTFNLCSGCDVLFIDPMLLSGIVRAGVIIVAAIPVAMGKAGRWGVALTR